MAIISVNIPDLKANKVYDAFDRAYNDPTENPTNAQKIAFVKGKIIGYIKEVIYSDEKNVATAAAGAGVVKDEDVAS